MKRDEAAGVLRKLGKGGLRRAALIQKTPDERVHVTDPFLVRRAFGVILSILLFCGVAAIAALLFDWTGSIRIGRFWIPVLILSAGTFGTFFAHISIRRRWQGVESRLLADHAKWLTSGETALILQAPMPRMGKAMDVFRQGGETPPVVFIRNPARAGPAGAVRSAGAPLSPDQLPENARRLATECRTDGGQRRSAPLLERLARIRQWIRLVCSDLSEAEGLEQRSTPVAEWILDNEYLIEGNSRDVQKNLTPGYYARLPVLKSTPYRGMPRVYGLSKELVSLTDLRVEEESIVAFTEAFQAVLPLTIGELWAVPQMLRIALIEGIQGLAAGSLEELRDREAADFWANRLITANRRDPDRLFPIMAELTENNPSPSPYFAVRLIDHLYDEEGALVPARSWLERVFRKPFGELDSRDQGRQARERISIGNAFGSLRQLALLDWRRIFERTSRVEKRLRMDPSRVYAGMDFQTRDLYRRSVEETAFRSGRAEEQVVQCALDLAAHAARTEAGEDRRSHVGTYLVGEGRGDLDRLMGSRGSPGSRALQWTRRHHSAAYLLGLGFLSAVFVSLIVLIGPAGRTPIRFLVAFLSLIPASQLALEILNYLVMRIFPPRTLPKMDFEVSGVPDSFRTLVVVPMMLEDPETIAAEIDKLEVRYLANRENNLLFGLFADYTDCETPRREEDRPLLHAAISGLEALNARHGGGRFFLFHRERVWCASERKYIGWERKRGKLEELNRFIEGTRPQGADGLVRVGDPDGLADVRFIITLDSDTQLPSGTARRMIETLAHPLNRPRFDAGGGIREGSYTVIQPRVSPSLPSSGASVFSRLFSYAVGLDPYTRAVSDVNQDLAGEGSYHGKGIYEVRAFSRALSGRFPEERLLSHDLLEGAHVRVGLASDIELIDEFPSDYLTYADRQHRWIRGDWQIADWILPRVPRQGGGRERNPLSRFNRWKILDNLRRSLVPAAGICLLAASWLTSAVTGWIAACIVLIPLLFQTLVQPITSATTPQGLRSLSPSRLFHDFMRTLVEAALLPHQAWLAMDAILRVWYRRIFSHRRLLEWASARTKRRNALNRRLGFVISLAAAGIISAAAGWAVHLWMPENLPLAGPWLALWLLSPAIGAILTMKRRVKPRRARLSGKDLMLLRKTARRTWRYFSDFVGEETSWLPPDNYQLFHQNRLAMRTSPTNIGLYMLSVLAAREYGYVTLDQAVETLHRSLKTIRGLERHEGHLLNWYDLETLKPLEPRYVSTVDSGNLLAALWSLEQGLEEAFRAPLLRAGDFEGLRDAAEIFRETMEREGSADPDASALARAGRSPPDGAVALLGLLRRTAEGIHARSDAEGEAPGSEEGSGYWAHHIRRQVSAMLQCADRYLGWMETAAEKVDELAAFGEDVLSAVRQGLREAPSLLDLAHDRVDCIRILRGIRESADPAALGLAGWLDRVLQAFDTSKWLAGEMLGLGGELAGGLRAFSDSVDMRFLYDPRRKLFVIGYNVSGARFDGAYYDLLASEARIASFLAIARGDVPAEHWFAMGRPYGSVGGRRMLLSWTGTMFEYLMPLLFQHPYAGSLLDWATGEAVAVQRAYGRRLRVPWGISESAFADLDIEKTYQYKAFGVPALGLKRGVEELVVAPYACILAIDIAPGSAVRNLKRLASLGLSGDYGYYDAVDFSRRGGPGGGTGTVVRVYLAHHQGMSFLALGNFLHGNPLRRHFHADARVRAVEPLLHERIPTLPPLHAVAARLRTPAAEGAGEVAPSEVRFDTPHTDIPRTQLLGNGRYCLMVTNAGGGYSRWGDVEITRWRADRTGDSWGTFCYFRESDSDRLWSNAFHPIGGRLESYSVSFALDRAVFLRTDNGIQTGTEIVVPPDDDVEIRRITVSNRSVRSRRLEITSYIELAMAPHAADLQHPAFNKLFVKTEAAPEHGALLASRRPRSGDEPPVFVAHRFTSADGGGGPLRYETDRGAFIGRGGTLARPMGLAREPGNTQGFVLDPILSLRRDVVLGPGERVQISLIIAAGETRARVMDLMAKYGDPHAVDRAMDLAWASSQVELRQLRIQPDEARRFQQLAGRLLFPNPLLRPPVERIGENAKGQAGLWPYGISGDLPMALVTIGEMRDIGLIRQMLQAHRYWGMRGLRADLVILDEEAGGYEKPLREAVKGLIQATGPGAPGGIFLLNADQIPEEDVTLLMASSRVVLVAARGTLPQQLSVASEAAMPEDFLAKRRAPRDPSAPLPFMELPYFNGLGGFTPDGREYAIYLGPGANTPAPWVNVIANPSFGTVVSESGSGWTWYGNSQRNRLTGWSNDPVTDPPSEALYIRDEETGLFWTVTAAPIREETAYRARHGAGYSTYEHNSHGIAQELTVFVPADERGGEPVKLQRLRVRNDSQRVRSLSVTYYAEWTLGENRESSQMHVVTAWDDETRTLTARNGYHPEYGERIAFAAMSPAPKSFSGDRTAFVGRNRTLGNPAAMERTMLSSRTGAGMDPCAALQSVVELAPGEQAEVICILGQADSEAEARRLVSSFADASAFQDALARTAEWWDDLLGTVQAHTPELAADFLINRWLLYQTLSCRIWARSAFYQSGGAFGFRDQLQDVMALLYSRPGLARRHILRAAGRQFAEGDVQHWWHEPGGAGIRSRISDDPAWLPYVVARYVRVTGDAAILDEEVPFLSAPPLKEEQLEVFLVPEVSSGRAALFEHCRRAISRALTAGPHGLPLIGTGDWNDGMNRVGAGGKGESVWLGWFLAEALRGMAELCRARSLPDAAGSYEREREALVRRIEGSAWDGGWYLRAFFDDGTPLGSSGNPEAGIDSLPQSWAVLSGAADSERVEKAMQSAWERLVREEEGLVLLFDPPLSDMEPSPGYIKAYPPGVRENGGQYTHAALWFAMAQARLGRGGAADKILRLLNPIEKAHDTETVLRYGVEPYVIAADVYYAPGRIGRGGWSWYTGSAAWMYRVWVEEVLGLKVEGDSLRVDPAIPGWWEGFRVSYRRGEAVYEIEVENPERRERGVSWVEMDGRRLGNGPIRLERMLVKHRILVRMGKPENDSQASH